MLTLRIGTSGTPLNGLWLSFIRGSWLWDDILNGDIFQHVTLIDLLEELSDCILNGLYRRKFAACACLTLQAKKACIFILWHKVYFALVKLRHGYLRDGT